MKALSLVTCLLLITCAAHAQEGALGECGCMCGQAGREPVELLGNQGKQSTFYDKIKGPRGDIGLDGEVGIEGISGTPGRRGVRGPPAADIIKYEESVYSSCKNILANGQTTSKVYRIKPVGSTAPLQTYCDQETAGGGWTLVASIHENNIHGKCTLGDMWSSQERVTVGNISDSNSWENFRTFGFPDAATSSDFKSVAYFTLKADNVMIWHVPNDTPITSWRDESFLQYHTSDNFLSSYGGTLQSLYSKYFPILQFPPEVEGQRGVGLLVDNIAEKGSQILALVPNFHKYSYDNANNQVIGDGGNDMYDQGNKISYQIENGPMKRITYGKFYNVLDPGVQIYSEKSHPFLILMYISNQPAKKDPVVSFGLQVESGTGADGNGHIASYTGELTASNVTCLYQMFHVYGVTDPSIFEVYFACFSPLWGSKRPPALARTRWSSSTDNLVNGVSAYDAPQNIIMGYTLLSRLSGGEISEEQARSALRFMMEDFQAFGKIPVIDCSRLNESLVVPVEYTKGSNVTVLAHTPPRELNHVEPGFIHFRSVDSMGNPNPLCPGVKSKACMPQSVCLGGFPVFHLSGDFQKTSCGDFAGWGGLPTDRANETVAEGLAKPLQDLQSTILIFTR